NLYKVVISYTARGHRITDLSCGRGNKLVIEPRISVRNGKKNGALTVCPVDGLSQDGLEVICDIFLTANPENESFLLREVGADLQEASSLR
ncbi:MAG: hypothetical protein ACFFC7_34045, partial [Candidatus Hermodarchaeota archaeon]